LDTLSHNERRLLVNPSDDISITRQAELLGISRASLYTTPRVNLEEIQIMSRIDEIYTKWPFYGSRRIRIALRDYDISISRRHIQRLMRIMGLTAIYPRRNTSIPDIQHPKYPYLLRDITASYPNHIWSTDITYIRMNGGFCYLVAIIDWYSRYIISWELSPTLEIDFCLRNLNNGLILYTPDIFNSDQGSHFTSPQHTGILIEKGIAISMDGIGRCLDNIFVERLWRSMKYECIFIHDYKTLSDVRAGLCAYIQFYNTERPHQSLDYKTPESVFLEARVTEH
jgi:putative transposase